jgi:hypothetical protein
MSVTVPAASALPIFDWISSRLARARVVASSGGRGVGGKLNEMPAGGGGGGGGGAARNVRRAFQDEAITRFDACGSRRPAFLRSAAFHSGFTIQASDFGSRGPRYPVCHSSRHVALHTSTQLDQRAPSGSTSQLFSAPGLLLAPECWGCQVPSRCRNLAWS